MTYQCKIKKVNNGFIFEPHTYDEIEVIEETATQEDRELYKTGDEEKIALGKLLSRVAEYFGVEYDKWTEDNLSITFDRKGSKME